jgi:hypothetical protein
MTQTIPAAPLILVTTAHPSLHHHPGPDGELVHPRLGRLLQPRHLSSVELTAAAGIPWAADNDCFQGLNDVAYVKMLDRLEGLAGCLFVTVPDVVGDARATRRLWHLWRDVADVGQPLALVAQDGLRSSDVPWDEMGALFIGGTTEWKESTHVADLVAEAKERGLHVHMGRVNGRRRLNYARLIGCDSIDGTAFSMFRDTWLPKAIDEWRVEPLRPHQHRLPL